MAGVNLGKSNGKWRGGTCLNDKGYRRISHGAARGKLEHRHVMQLMLDNPIGLCHFPISSIPPGATVHHIDHQRRHNCQSNLMLLDKIIHDAISRSRKRYILDHYAEFVIWSAEQDRWE